MNTPMQGINPSVLFPALGLVFLAILVILLRTQIARFSHMRENGSWGDETWVLIVGSALLLVALPFLAHALFGRKAFAIAFGVILLTAGTFFVSYRVRIGRWALDVALRTWGFSIYGEREYRKGIWLAGLGAAFIGFLVLLNALDGKP